MSNALRSPALFRTILTDTSAELATFNSVPLPNGAAAYDNQSATLWRLNKTVGTALDSLLGSGLLLKPDDQSSARWIAEAVSGSNSYYFASYLAAPVAVNTAANQWTMLGSTAGNFALSMGSAALYTLNPTTGLVTYNGPPRIALVTMQASLNNNSTATSIAVHAAISRSGDVAVGTTNNYPNLGEQAENITNLLSAISVQREMILNPGTTLQLALRNATNGDFLLANYYQMTVTPF